MRSVPEVIYITVIIHCKPTRVEDCLTRALKTREASLKETGCIDFLVTQSKQDPCKILLLESYQNHAAFEEHQEQNYMQEFGTLVANEYAENIQFYMSSAIN